MQQIKQINFKEGDKILIYYIDVNNSPRIDRGIVLGSNKQFLFLFDEMHKKKFSISLNSINKIENFVEHG